MTPLVLLHAFPFDRDMFHPQLEAMEFVSQYSPVHLPGFGGVPVEPGISVDGMARFVISRFEQYGYQRAVVGGVSMGGYVAMAVARNYPERVSGLIIADTRAEPDSDEAKANRDVDAGGKGTHAAGRRRRRKREAHNRARLISGKGLGPFIREQEAPRCTPTWNNGPRSADECLSRG